MGSVRFRGRGSKAVSQAIGMVLAIATLGTVAEMGRTQGSSEPHQDPSLIDLERGLAEFREAQVQTLLEGYRQRRPVQWRGDRDPWLLENAMQIRDPFVAALEQEYGAPIGYKAALVNPAVRSRFNATQPIRGLFFPNMLYPSGTPLSVSVATRPLVEGDILVRVGDAAALRRARTDDEIWAALDAVIPFIEIPDLIYTRRSIIDARAIAAANGGARAGWMGDPVPMTLKDWKNLSQVQVQMTTTVRGETTTRTVALGQGLGMEPVAVVRWLRDELGQDGIEIKDGDVLSLGTVLPPVPAWLGMEISVRYMGLGEGDGAIVLGRFMESQ